LNQGQRDEDFPPISEGRGGNFDTKVSLIQAFIPIGIMAVEEFLYEEVEALTGPPHHRRETGGFP